MSRSKRKLRHAQAELTREQARALRDNRLADLPWWRQPTLGAMISKLLGR